MVEWTTYLFFWPVRLTSSKTHPVRPGGRHPSLYLITQSPGDANRPVLVFIMGYNYPAQSAEVNRNRLQLSSSRIARRGLWYCFISPGECEVLRSVRAGVLAIISVPVRPRHIAAMPAASQHSRIPRPSSRVEKSKTIQTIVEPSGLNLAAIRSAYVQKESSKPVNSGPEACSV